MAFKDRLQHDLDAVIFNVDSTGEYHTWNRHTIRCHVDEETALRRKNENVIDVGWDNTTTEKVIYASVEGFPSRPVPGMNVFFDDRPYRVLQAQDDMGMYTILIVATAPKNGRGGMQ